MDLVAYTFEKPQTIQKDTSDELQDSKTYTFIFSKISGKKKALILKYKLTLNESFKIYTYIKLEQLIFL